MKRFSLIFGLFVMMFVVVSFLTSCDELTTKTMIYYSILFVLGLYHFLRGLRILPENW